MKNTLLAALAGASLFLLPATALRAQNGNTLLTGSTGGATNGTFLIKAINVSLPKTPEYSTVGGEGQAKRYTLGTWMEIEVEFASSARAPEVAFHYNILINRTLLVGDQTLVDVPAGQSLFTLMYVAPRTLSTLLGGQLPTVNTAQNIAVQILRPGVAQPLAMKMLHEGPAFYTTMQQTPNFVLNKSETPFSMLWWDRYEAVKPSPQR